MLIQQGFRPVRAIIFDGALGFAAAESCAIFIRLLGGPIALDAFPVPIEINEIAQRSLRQSPFAKHGAIRLRE
jgi:hypothetical protein